MITLKYGKNFQKNKKKSSNKRQENVHKGLKIALYIYVSQSQIFIGENSRFYIKTLVRCK